MSAFGSTVSGNHLPGRSYTSRSSALPAGSTKMDLLRAQGTAADAATGNSHNNSLEPSKIADRVLEPHLNGDRVKQFAEELHDLNAAHKLSGSDDKTHVKQIASVVTKILELDSESFNSSSIGVTNWLSPESIDFGYKVKLIDDADKAVLADAIAIAWNEGAIPLESTAAGLKRSALDSAAFYRNGSMIAQLFDGNTSSHINEFRASFAQHLYENYATPKAKLLSANELPHTLKTRDWDPSLFVANIVTGDGVPTEVRTNFYNNTFPEPNKTHEHSEKFVSFITNATETFSQMVGHHQFADPFNAFAEIPGGANNPAGNIEEAKVHQRLAVDLAVAIGLTRSDPGASGISFSGILDTDSAFERKSRQEAMIGVFNNHSDEILNVLASTQPVLIDTEGKVFSRHDALVSFFRHVIADSSLDKADQAMTEVVNFFDKQVKLVSDPFLTNTTAANRAINAISAAGIAVKHVVSDAKAVAEARAEAFEYSIGLVTKGVIPSDKIANYLESIATEYSGSLSGDVVIPILTEFFTDASSKGIKVTIDELKNAVISDPHSHSINDRAVATSNLLFDRTINKLRDGLILDDDVLEPSNENSVGLIPENKEGELDRIIKDVQNAVADAI